jgi:hypothetical protein
MNQDKPSSQVPDMPEAEGHRPESHEVRSYVAGRGHESPVASSRRVLVSELNGIFARVPRLGNDADTLERDIADALTVLTDDQDPWNGSCGLGDHRANRTA